MTVLLLGAAGWFAYQQVKHAREARREQERPFVIVDVFGSRAQVFRLEIMNIGKTIARDVAIAFDPALESTQDVANRRVRNVPILARGAPTLAPGKRHTLLLDSAPARRAADLPDSYDVTVTYIGHDGTEYQDEQVVDLGVYWDTPDLRERDIHDIWNELDKMRTSLHGIHEAILNLNPDPQGNWQPLPRTAPEPQSPQQMPRSMEGSGLPADTDDDEDHDSHGD